MARYVTSLDGITAQDSLHVKRDRKLEGLLRSRGLEYHLSMDGLDASFLSVDAIDDLDARDKLATYKLLLEKAYFITIDLGKVKLAEERKVTLTDDRVYAS